MDSYSVLLDNSATRRLALRDPDASLSNKIIKKHTLIPVLSPFALGEIVKGLVKRPLDSELCGRCHYLLRLENLYMARDVDDGIRIEYLYEDHSAYDFEVESKQAKSMNLLRQCANGLVPLHLREVSQKHHALERARGEAYVNQILESKDLSAFASAPLETFATEEVVYQAARDILKLHFEVRGRLPMPEAVDRVARRAAYNPRQAPFLAAATRVQIWANWYVAHNGRIPSDFQKDLPFLVSALATASVLTADVRMLKIGPDLFPEVKFLNTQRFIENFDRFS